MRDALTFASDALPASARLLGLRGREALSTPYAFDVALLVPTAESLALDEEATLGAAARLETHRDDGAVRSTIHGQIAALELVGSLTWHDVYRATLVPRLWRLSLSQHSRVFVNRKIPDVIEAVLKGAGLSSYRLELTRSYAPREHVCQYRESDLDFVSRWMEREGMTYFFEQGDEEETLVICDDPSAHKPLVAEPLRFIPGGGGTGAVESLQAFSRAHGARATEVVLKDYDYLKPMLDLSGKSPATKVGANVVSEFGEHLADPAEAKRLAKVRAEEEVARQVLHHGVGRAFDLRPGYLFELDEHPDPELDGRYLTVALDHHARQLGGAEGVEGLLEDLGLGGDDEHVYLVGVTALAAQVPFRPSRRTPVPRISGVESAWVDGPAESEYAQLDDHGRYLVRIGFDESGLGEGKASTRIRMLQPHGGSPEGWHLPLRKGTEVLLSFVGGDPDRPVISAVGPNADIPSPVALDNHTHNVVQTGGLSRLEIEDQDGAQYVDASTPPEKTFVHLGAHHGAHDHNFVIATDGDKHMHTGGNRDITVGGDQTEDVTGDLTEDYHSDQKTHVFASFDETIDGDATQTIHAGSTQAIDGGLTQKIDSGDTRTVTGDLTEDLVGGRTQTIDGDSTERISGSQTQTIVGGATISTPASYKIDAAGGFTAVAPAGITVVAAAGQQYVAPAGHTNVDNFLTRIGSFKHDEFGVGFSAATFKLDSVMALSMGLYATKIETGGVKLDGTICSFKSNTAEIKSFGIALAQLYLNLHVVGLFIKP